jgi:CBS domain-containing protein
MSREIQARDIMQMNVICVSPEASLAEVRDLFIRHRISGAPVVDEEGLIGVISLSDIARVGLAKDVEDFPENSYFIGLPLLYGAELNSLQEQLEDRVVEEAMSTEVYTASADDRISVLAVTMRHHRIHRLIITEEKKVVGIVTAFDLIQVLENH